jgi:sulfur relay (sulfurtransferase) complex TusBCD TusD component (DsrE family)
MTKFTLLISKPPFDKISSFTGARIAVAAKMEDSDVTVILMEDGVYCGMKGQESKEFFKISELLENLLELGGKVLVCGMCIKERGIPKELLIKGAEIIDLHTLVRTMAAGDQTVFF